MPLTLWEMGVDEEADRTWHSWGRWILIPCMRKEHAEAQKDWDTKPLGAQEDRTVDSLFQGPGISSTPATSSLDSTMWTCLLSTGVDILPLNLGRFCSTDWGERVLCGSQWCTCSIGPWKPDTCPRKPGSTSWGSLGAWRCHQWASWQTAPRPETWEHSRVVLMVFIKVTRNPRRRHLKKIFFWEHLEQKRKVMSSKF